MNDKLKHDKVEIETLIERNMKNEMKLTLMMLLLLAGGLLFFMQCKKSMVVPVAEKVPNYSAMAINLPSFQGVRNDNLNYLKAFPQAHYYYINPGYEFKIGKKKDQRMDE